MKRDIAFPDPATSRFRRTLHERLEGLYMSNFDHGPADDVFPHLADSIAEHHQVVTIGSPEEQQLDHRSDSDPQATESLDDWL
ncbi:hypothetical protein [Glutamicibacter sp. JC586]|uniref:hypothetical protein n=1 Tax=Glutamicibacter sp. JC586 TaxID=2590552 RepID=UPI0013584DED|nr:hypothetical protein [Glutamicibacter sp. JC586]